MATDHQFSTAPWYRWYVLAIIFTIYVCNVADRYILAILAQDVKADLGLSDLEVGLLIGPAVGLFYAILGIPMAYLADRTNRVRFLALCLLGWSFLTAAGGGAANALQLGLARIGVSAVEAGGSPASASILADYFKTRERPTAMGIYGGGASVGILVSFAVGGLINEMVGWRWTLVAAGLPGLVLALLVFLTVREPVRGATDEVKPSHSQDRMPVPLMAGVKMLLANRFYRHVILTAGLLNIGLSIVAKWGPALMIRRFEAGTATAGASMGLGIALFGAGVAIIGGRIISQLSHHGIRKPLKIAFIMMLLSWPALLGGLLAPDAYLSAILLCASYGLQSFFVPIYWSVAQSHVDPRLRGMATALLLLTIAVIATGLSPPLIGFTSDMLLPMVGNRSLQYALIAFSSFNLVAALAVLHALRIVPREAGRQEFPEVSSLEKDGAWSTSR